MKAKVVRASLLLALVAWAAHPSKPLAADKDRDADKASEHGKGNGIRLDTRQVEEGEAQGRLGEPHYGYVGFFGSFEAAAKGPAGQDPVALFVVHHHPDQHNVSLGHTTLKYKGPKRLGSVDGWLFETRWDGKMYPSKIFFSAEKIYFGGGVVAYIAADYREGTGWGWKYHPLRRMDLVAASHPTSAGR
jgi:hypothetical protein